MMRSPDRLFHGARAWWLAGLVATLLTVTGSQPRAAATELFFSEYVEGTSNNKALEIYNATGVALDLAAESYNVQMFFNGNPVSTLTINLTGVVADGDVYVLAHASAGAAILAEANQTNGAGWYNGDDAVVLRKGTTIVDAIGQVGFDPGTEWGSALTSTADNTLRRKPAVCAGDANEADAFDPSIEFDGFATDTFDGLGSHNASCDGSEDAAPTVVSTVPPDGGLAFAGANLAVTFSEPVSFGASGLTLVCSASGTKTTSVSGGSTAFTIDPATDFASGESCTLTILAAGVTDLDANDPPDNLPADAVVTFTVIDVCSAAYTPIWEIQGAGLATPLPGARTTRGVVVGDYEGPAPTLRGFYIQDPAGDGNDLTSDGLFVFNGNSNSVNLGDVVVVTGNATEFQDQTQISASSVTVCGTGTVTPVDVTLPVPTADHFERFEGMLVRLPQTLPVTEHFQLGRFGQVVVSSGGRLRQPTDVLPPGADAEALQLENDRNRIIIDDGLNNQNPDPIVFGRGGMTLSAANTLRGGDTATNTVGVLTYTWAGNAASGNAYRVRPVGSLDGFVRFDASNPRPAAAPPATGSLRVASMNLLNFFNTFAGCTNGVGGPATDCRGAENDDEFNRQWPKAVDAILGAGADIVGVIEVENDGYAAESALAFLVDRLNQATVPGTWAFIDADAATGEVNALGTDAIKVALLYKPLRVVPVGQTGVLNTTAFVTGGDAEPRNRAALAQAFEEFTTGARAVVSVNHLKSKGSACDAPDAGDGQGECNAVRTNAALALASWLASDPTGTGDPDVLIVGDLNAYTMEDPVRALAEAGFANLVHDLGGDLSYSFVFDGQWGSLDHGLASDSLRPQVTAARVWHINADEPGVLDYNTNFKSAGQIASLYAPDRFRMADHDVLLVDLALDPNIDTSASVLGAGQILLTSPAGAGAGDPGSLAHFVLNARYFRGVQAPHGQAHAIFRRTDDDGLHVYHVWAPDIAAFVRDPATGRAVVVARAIIHDVAKPWRPILVDAHATLRFTVDDNGTPGINDTAGITVLDSTGALWFSSHWNGVGTVNQPLVGGNVHVR
jgi:predicted extracellular nuclease